MRSAALASLILVASSLLAGGAGAGGDFKWTSLVARAGPEPLDVPVTIAGLNNVPLIEVKLPASEAARRGVRIVVEDDGAGGVRVSVYDRRKDSFGNVHWEERSRCASLLLGSSGSATAGSR